MALFEPQKGGILLQSAQKLKILGIYAQPGIRGDLHFECLRKRSMNRISTTLSKNRAFRSALIVLIIMLQGCTLKLANLITPNNAYDDVKNIVYGNDKRQSIDIYFPKNNSYKEPVLIFFYGGAWEEGNKEQYRFLAQRFTEQGYRVAIPDYRIYPQVVFPAFIDDGAAAVAKIATEFPKEPLILIGHSAGAHIAAMLTLNKNYLKSYKVDYTRIKAWIGWSGPYDFLPLQSDKMKKIFPEENREESQPINFVDASEPPTLLIQGLDDEIVIPRNSRNLEEKLKKHGIKVVSHYYPDVGHIATIGSLVSFFSGWTNTLPDTLKFLDEL